MDFESFSIGTQPLIKQLEQEIPSKEYPIDTVFLNLGTLVRNCAGNDVVKEAIENEKRRGVETDYPAQVLLQEAKKEMIGFIQHICQVFNNSPLVHNPTFISYHANYRLGIPEELYRIPVHSKRVVTRADELVRTSLITGQRKESTVGKVRLIELPLNDRHLPWKHLLEEMRTIKNNHLVAMITNHPVDYHVGIYCRTFRLFRSYTGDIVWYKHLGKHVFGDENIPFNIYTHAVLGDKEDVKASVQGSSKKKLIEIATENDWSLRTADYIRDALYRLNIRIPTNF